MNSSLWLEEINYINDKEPTYPYNCFVQVRHQHKPVQCSVDKNNNGFLIKFSKKIRAIAPGQSAVLYNKDICLGGGIIAKTFK